MSTVQYSFYDYFIDYNVSLVNYVLNFEDCIVENDDETLAKEVFLYVNQAFFQLVKEIDEREDSKYYLALARILESFLKFEEEIYT